MAIIDTGVGIPEADLPHVFEEFYRASNVKQEGITGTGLGLAIVKDLVESYEGPLARLGSQHGGQGHDVNGGAADGAVKILARIVGLASPCQSATHGDASPTGNCLSVHSTVGGGTTFTVVLPMAQ